MSSIVISWTCFLSPSYISIFPTPLSLQQVLTEPGQFAILSKSQMWFLIQHQAMSLSSQSSTKTYKNYTSQKPLGTGKGTVRYKCDKQMKKVSWGQMIWRPSSHFIKQLCISWIVDDYWWLLDIIGWHWPREVWWHTREAVHWRGPSLPELAGLQGSFQTISHGFALILNRFNHIQSL